jgi:hypothetical protein
MKRFLKIFSVAICIVFLPSIIYAQADWQRIIDKVKNPKNAGQAAMPFLKLGAGARSMAMGDAVNTLKGDPAALFYNPAGMAYNESQTQIMFGYMDWLLDTKLISSAVTTHINGVGTFGASLLYYDYGDPIIATEINGDPKSGGYNVIGEMNPIEMVVGIGYARRISDKFSIGGQAKIAYQDLLGSGGVKYRTSKQTETIPWEQESKEAKKTVVAFDLGTFYDTRWRGLSFSMSIRNFGQEIKYEQESFDIPLLFRLGVAFEVFELLNMDTEHSSIFVAIDRQHPRDWYEQMHYGLEYAFHNLLFLRAGYKENYTSEGLTLGFGLRIPTIGSRDIRIDYAYKTGEATLGNVNIFTMVASF